MRGKALSGALLVMSLLAMAQEPAAKTDASCYKDKSVDEYIVELNKRQKGTRNPLPNDICIFAMCSHTGVGPSEGKKEKAAAKAPQQQPSAKPPAGKSESDVSEVGGVSDVSSSKKENAEVAETLAAEASSYDPVRAARDADVGDYYYRDKNYRGALMRYADAVKAKPGDAAIYLRMGRSWEKLKAPERAYLHYDAVVKLEPEGKSAAEARAAMQRLQPELQKAGVDPATLVREEQPERAPCLAPPKESR